MQYQVRYTGLAFQEVKEAFGWYREQASDQVPERFLKEVDRAEGHLRSNPQLYQRMTDEVRHLVLRRYPYALVYAISTDVVLVLGCFHSSRKPLTMAAWLARDRDGGVLESDDLH
jgi:toxin ParE1/3/4